MLYFAPDFSNVIISYANSCQQMPLFYVKREMPILFPVNCERTNLFSVKRDLDGIVYPVEDGGWV